MNQTTNLTAIAVLLNAGEHTIREGAAYALADDPHRFVTLPLEFDGGRAIPRLVIDYLAGGGARITTLMMGTKGGEQCAVQVFQPTVQGPAPALAH